MTIKEMIANAERALKQSCVGGEEYTAAGVHAQAWLMRADLELRLEERAARRHGAAVILAQKLIHELPHMPIPATKVIPTPDGFGFLISIEDGYRQEHRSQIFRVWQATEPYRAAGWKFSFSFRGKPCADGHGYTDMPFCVACGYVPEASQ